MGGPDQDVSETHFVLSKKTDPSDRKYPNFSDAEEIGNFSIGPEREYIDGTANLKYLWKREPEGDPGWNLNLGYNEAIRRDRSVHEKMDNLLHWIVRNKHKFPQNPAAKPSSEVPSAEPPSLFTDFICNRGALRRLAFTCYKVQKPWLLAACRFRGSIYLCAYETEQEREERLSQMADTRGNRIRFWGCKFQQLMVSEEPSGAPNAEAPVKECEAFCSVLRRQLNTHSLVFAAEVAAIDPGKPRQEGSMDAYVELKCSRQCLTNDEKAYFRRCTKLRWWLQAYLAGIPRVVCGFRNDDGCVISLKFLDVRGIANKAECQGHWYGSWCMNTCDQLLSFIKESVKEDDPRVIYLFNNERKHLERRVLCKRAANPEAFNMLPDWYLQEFDFM
ncbi:decapping and exoribonuclease protein-like [Amblyomma americanum]